MSLTRMFSTVDTINISLMTDIDKPDRIALGIILVLSSTFLVALQDAVIKEASSTITLWQIYVIRSLILIPLFLLLGMFWGEGATTLRNALRFWPLVRSACFIAMYFTMYATIQFVPLSLIAAGIYTAPLFVVIITTLAGIESPSPRRWLAIAIGFAGMLFILKPGTDTFSWLTVIPIFGGLFYALVGIVTRTKCYKFAPTTLAVSLSIALLLIGILGSITMVFWNPQSTINSNSGFLTGSWDELGYPQWGMIIALVVLMFGNGLVLPTAYQVAPTTIIATFDYCYLIFATLLGFVLFSEIPDLLSIIGMLLIVVAGVIIARNN